jgi:DNA end-binding protein Ku
MRSIWKGHIQFSLVTIPVRIYSAINSAQNISFNQLHKDCNGRIGYDKKCKKCSQQVGNEEIVKGYQYETDQYVIIESEDLEKLRLKSTRIIEIQGFVDASEIHPTLYEAPYFAGPDGEAAAKAYGLLCEALKESGKVGIGKVVLRDREDVVIIAPQDRGLVLYKLRYPEEVQSITEVPQLENRREIDREQLKLARHLLDTMSTSLAQLDLKDKYNEALREVIDAKVQGKEIVTYAPEARPVVDIMTALKESIEQAKSQREPMVKATGTAKKAKAEPEPAEGKGVKSRKSKLA